MISGLIKKQQIRLFKKKLDQGDLGLLTSGKSCYRTFFIFFLKSQTCKKGVIFPLIFKTFPVKRSLCRAV